MNRINLRYWACQLIGWGGWSLLNFLFARLLAYDFYFGTPEKSRIFYWAMLIGFVIEVLVTHCLRLIIKRYNWMRLSTTKVFLLFVFAVAITGFMVYYMDKVISEAANCSFVKIEQQEKLESAKKMEEKYSLVSRPYYINPDSSQRSVALKIKTTTGWYRNTIGEWRFEGNQGRVVWILVMTYLLIGIWLLLYMVYHYVQKNRNDQIDRLKLESTVKELELKTIKSHINPHFIFNSLNSIRALVDEDPQRARTAITELSNILRSSMQAEKQETVSLKNELAIVTDYLALEQMRFEERLKIELDIDDDTLEQQVPPMMLQTLVENAIKHGISKNMAGGYVKIISRFVDDHHELSIQNSGQLSNLRNGDGFGIKSTEDRLNLLYQGKASFALRNLDEKSVESKVILPVNVI